MESDNGIISELIMTDYGIFASFPILTGDGDNTPEIIDSIQLYASLVMTAYEEL